MKSLNTLFLLLLAFVFLTTTGFTCQKKYPQPAPESNESDSATTEQDGLSSSENSNSPSETSPSSEGDSKKPIDKTDQ